MVAWMFNGRYLILLMALYAMWMGALYNEFFAVTMDFGSAWRVTPNTTDLNIVMKHYGPNGTYTFGVDPVWKGASNELLYDNSVKMKMSIIVGVIQMTVGIFLHLLNAIEFGKWMDIFFRFLPTNFIFGSYLWLFMFYDLLQMGCRLG